MILGCSKYGRLAANAIKTSHAPSPATMTTTIAMIPAHDVPDNVGHLRLPVYPAEPINALIAHSGRAAAVLHTTGRASAETAPARPAVSD
jgi:hypothetical protein